MNKINTLIILMALLLGGVQGVKAQAVVVNEYSADPGNNESDGEFVELYCVGPADCDVSCYTIITDDNGGAIMFDPGTTIPAGGFLVAGSSSEMSCATCDYPGIATNLSTLTGGNSIFYDTDGASGAYNSAFALNNTSGASPNGVFLLDASGNLVSGMTQGDVTTTSVDHGISIATGCNDWTGGAFPAVTAATINGFYNDAATLTFTDPVAGSGGAGVPTGCSSSTALSTDGGTTIVDDNSPTPGLPNNSPAGNTTVTVTDASGNVVGSLATQQFDILEHDGDGDTGELADNITISASDACNGPFTVTYTVEIPNWVGIYAGGEPTGQSDEDDRTEIEINEVLVSTGTVTDNDFTATWGLPTVTPNATTSITTITQTVTVTEVASPTVTNGVFDIEFNIQENYTATADECTYTHSVNLTVEACNACGFTADVALVEACGVFDFEISNIVAEDAGQTTFNVNYGTSATGPWTTGSTGNALPFAGTLTEDVDLTADGSTQYYIQLVDGTDTSCTEEFGPFTAPSGNTPRIDAFPANN